ncbi:AfsR/SARP family transcriptional regulator [Actinophytocola sp.]|uniref:AfsR/SARP family transcriptional regulator n=1 Tax=Actinophytocola sp. TaxID=1872138 RepID=UPI002D7F09A3|nr:AfsR/SARP family transcriptional regulator [Actinophytocola sp.]HET9142301.1 AfsR/SARP family transcriptional regulator [Actinophytocola sp.]HEU5111051.1 AfsR/SARP family transcriptional regulator [Micromonosporaceae bacterium]
MKVKVLGPLEAWHNGVPVVPTARKPRQVLAMLAICARQLIPVSTLIEELWGITEAPRSATQLVQTYILRLRQHIDDAMLAGAGKQILITRPGGYTLDIAPEDVDVHRFAQLSTSGERAMEAGDYAAASKLLGSALETWRGPTLVDVRVGFRLGVEVERLEQSRLGVLESRIEADLRIGRHHQLLGELAELTALYPLHEKLCEQYMTALYACGCKWKALEIYRRLRKRLVDELGVEPSVQVQQLQHAILNSDVDLDAVAIRRPAPIGAVG